MTSLVVAPAAGIRVGAGAGIGAPSESEAGLGRNERIHRYANFLASVQTRCTTHAAALLAFVIREALGSRPAPGTLSAKRSVGTRRAASMQDTLSEGTARAARSWHLQRSTPAQSEDLPPEVWLPTLSDDERLVEEHKYQ